MRRTPPPRSLVLMTARPPVRCVMYSRLFCVEQRLLVFRLSELVSRSPEESCFWLAEGRTRLPSVIGFVSEVLTRPSFGVSSAAVGLGFGRPAASTALMTTEAWLLDCKSFLTSLSTSESPSG